jgi:hypothetical protein
MLKAMVYGSLVSMVAAGTFRSTEPVGVVKNVEDMAKFASVSAKTEESKLPSAGGPVDWPPVGVGAVSFIYII